MDVVLVYHSTHMVLAMQIFNAFNIDPINEKLAKTLEAKIICFIVLHFDYTIGITMQQSIFRIKGKHTQLHGVIQDLIRDRAGKGSLNRNLDHGTKPPEVFQHAEEKPPTPGGAQG